MAVAKITPPVFPRSVPRARLFDWIDRSTSARILWVHGPAGSGKTALAAGYVEAHRLPTVWYSIDERDIDSESFARDFVRAVRRAAGREKNPSSFPSERQLQKPDALKALYAELTTPAALLVYDNVHMLPSLPAVQNWFIRTLAELPLQSRALLLSRSEPPAWLREHFRALDLAVLAPDALRFSSSEAKQLARARGSRTLDAQAVEQALEHSHGWATGLVLLLDAAASTPEAPETATEILAGYFEAEVYRSLKPALQRFLLRTSYLPSFRAEEAQLLSGEENAEALLEDLARTSGFAEKAADSGVYRINPLFRDFLRTRASGALSRAEQEETKYTAAALLLTADSSERSAEFLIELGDWNVLRRLLFERGPALYRAGAFRELLHWIESIPPQVRDADPHLLYWQGACRLSYKDDSSVVPLKRAYALFRAHHDPAGSFLSWAAIVDAYIGQMDHLQPLDTWITELDALAKEFQHFPSPEVELHVVASLLFALLYRCPDHPTAPDWLARAERLLENREFEAFQRTYLSLPVLAFSMWFGDGTQFRTIGAALLSLEVSTDSPPIAVMQHSAIALAARAAGDSQGVLRSVFQGLDAVEQTHGQVSDVHLLILGAFAALDTGDLELAEHLTNRIEHALTRPSLVHLAQRACLAAQIALRRGDTRDAVHHAEAAYSRSREAGVHYHEALHQLGVALAHCAEGDFYGALSHAVQCLRFARETDARNLEFTCLFYQANTQFALGDSGHGYESLRAALTLGRERSFAHLSWWVPEIAAQLCSRALAHGIEVNYVKQLIREHQLKPDSSAATNPDWPWFARVFTLGRFEVSSDEQLLDVDASAHHRPLDLLKVLIAFGGVGVSDERISEALWPDADGDAARRTFGTTLHRLRKLFRPDDLRLKSGKLSLDLSACWVDALALNELAKQERQSKKHTVDTESARASIEQLLRLYRGPFLPGISEAWAHSARERLRSQFLQLLLQWNQSLERAKQWEQAGAYYEQALAADDLSEELYQRTMQCHIEAGRLAQARATYRRCREHLQRAFGVLPSPETERIYQSLLK